MWRRRKPDVALGTPPLPSVPPRMAGVAAIVLLIAALLPAGSVAGLDLDRRARRGPQRAGRG
jgi:hypothetical protein